MTSLYLEIGENSKVGDEFLKKAVMAASGLTLDRIKELIIKNKDKSAIPRINKGNYLLLTLSIIIIIVIIIEKYVGKLLKGDFLATLIDILREDNQNDYEKVYNIVSIETKKGGAKAAKGGFGSVKKLEK